MTSVIRPKPRLLLPNMNNPNDSHSGERPQLRAPHPSFKKKKSQTKRVQLGGGGSPWVETSRNPTDYYVCGCPAVIGHRVGCPLRGRSPANDAPSTGDDSSVPK